MTEEYSIEEIRDAIANEKARLIQKLCRLNFLHETLEVEGLLEEMMGIEQQLWAILNGIYGEEAGDDGLDALLQEPP